MRSRPGVHGRARSGSRRDTRSFCPSATSPSASTSRSRSAASMISSKRSPSRLLSGRPQISESARLTRWKLRSRETSAMPTRLSSNALRKRSSASRSAAWVAWRSLMSRTNAWKRHSSPSRRAEIESSMGISVPSLRRPSTSRRLAIIGMSPLCQEARHCPPRWASRCRRGMIVWTTGRPTISSRPRRRVPQPGGSTPGSARARRCR